MAIRPKPTRPPVETMKGSPTKWALSASRSLKALRVPCMNATTNTLAPASHKHPREEKRESERRIASGRNSPRPVVTEIATVAVTRTGGPRIAIAE
jgi:hypothetical protein